MYRTYNYPATIGDHGHKLCITHDENENVLGDAIYTEVMYGLKAKGLFDETKHELKPGNDGSGCLDIIDKTTSVWIGCVDLYHPCPDEAPTFFTIERPIYGIAKIQIKRFRSEDARIKFLDRGDNRDEWEESKHNVKSGMYLKRLEKGGIYEVTPLPPEMHVKNGFI